MMERSPLWAAMFGLAVPVNLAIAQDLSPEIAVANETVVLQAHAVGAQIYECKRGENGALNGVFREPVASFYENDKTVGRHYAGPRLEVGESISVRKDTARAPGATDQDIPWLKLRIVDSLGDPQGPWRRPTR